MKVISRPVAAGKTHAAIIEAGKTGATIVCATNEEAERVYDQSRSMGIDILKPRAWEISMQHFRGKSLTVIVDNVDWLLQEMFGSRIHAVTLTGRPDSIE